MLQLLLRAQLGQANRYSTTRPNENTTAQRDHEILRYYIRERNTETRQGDGDVLCFKGKRDQLLTLQQQDV